MLKTAELTQIQEILMDLCARENTSTTTLLRTMGIGGRGAEGLLKETQGFSLRFANTVLLCAGMEPWAAPDGTFPFVESPFLRLMRVKYLCETRIAALKGALKDEEDRVLIELYEEIAEEAKYRGSSPWLSRQKK